jgi:hypothetical protein
MLLYGDFQPKMRTQYTAQYNFTIQSELARDLVMQIGYVGSQGHRLLASHDINAANPQTCLDIATLAQGNTPTSTVVSSYGAQASCGPFSRTTNIRSRCPQANRSILPNGFHLPNGTTVQSAGKP